MSISLRPAPFTPLEQGLSSVRSSRIPIPPIASMTMTAATRRETRARLHIRQALEVSRLTPSEPQSDVPVIQARRLYRKAFGHLLVFLRQQACGTNAGSPFGHAPELPVSDRNRRQRHTGHGRYRPFLSEGGQPVFTRAVSGVYRHRQLHADPVLCIGFAPPLSRRTHFVGVLRDPC